MKRRRAPTGRVAALILTVGVAACGSGVTTAPGAKAPDPSLISRGAEAYAASCASCHGDDLHGTDEGPSLISVVYEPGHHADVAFLFAVQRGVRSHHWGFGDMPPIDGVSDQDVEAIVALVRDAQAREGFEPYSP